MIYSKVNDVKEVREMIVEEIEKIQNETSEMIFWSMMGKCITKEIVEYDLEEIIKILIPEIKKGIITILVMYDARDKKENSKKDIVEECEETINHWKIQYAHSEITSYLAVVDSGDKYEAIGVLCQQDDFDEESPCANKLCYLYGKHDSTLSRNKVELIFGSENKKD